MGFNRTGITTGLMGYSLKKEWFGDSFFYRELEIFNYEIFSSDVSGLSPLTIQKNILNEFGSKYSGDVHVKVFQIPSEYSFPSDSIRNSKFNVEIQIRKFPTGLGSYSEFSNSYYAGVPTSLFSGYADTLIDLKEEFSFDRMDNGRKGINHNISFSLTSGGKSAANNIANVIFSSDKDINLGVFSSTDSEEFDVSNVLNLFNESYDLLKNNFSFSKRREFLPKDDINYNKNISNSLTLKDDGIYEISEKCDIQGKLNFEQAKNGLENEYLGSFNRCTNILNSYQNIGNLPSNTTTLATMPIKLNKNFIKQNLFASYEVIYTDNPEVKSNGSLTEEIIETEFSPKKITNINHIFNFTFNKRNSSFISANNLIGTSLSGSYNTINNYYGNLPFYNGNWPINRIKYNTSWPSYKNKASLTLNYTNEPKYFITYDNILFNLLDYKITNNKPVDIITEYKTINRPNKLSVINYAYQTEKGEVAINLNSFIGRDPNQFINGFTANISEYIRALYKKGIELFMYEFNNIIPVSFTYFLSDIKYSFNSEANLQVNMTITYTLKKHIL